MPADPLKTSTEVIGQPSPGEHTQTPGATPRKDFRITESGAGVNGMLGLVAGSILNGRPTRAGYNRRKRWIGLMNLCEQCGSSSRDRDGFCAGCGARWPQAKPNHAADRAGSKRVLPFAELPVQTSSFGIFEAGPKKVWAAVLLALLLGPFGLLYCTITGTIVMLIVSLALQLLLGSASFLIVLPICAIWAWRAARECTSAFD